ncbi:MAG: 5-amino-6-(D-ribitylamino)uracil--L-tyrosine 4-hydroxyphenyl transferase CofH [Candidatus Dadabacteria bacterium]|nr:5-amino-6-(D-ribitylamino)uracil--L-tyrosine 4-hydroxyphenyl transferase CofH [Candidatus Dadabacteria bacterium]NIQ16449.1 5-amino-6-(D-ribitylamino)uracil--L-tyrosine 4-hydroxyphenyl transferase CofH [Candidatus Dadabacteria bacterium]
MENINYFIEKIEEIRSKGLDGALSGTNGKTGNILNKALVGGEVSVEDGIHLFGIEDMDEISALALTADEIRKEDVGDVVTYVVNRNINFTNICNVYCGFCNFMADEGDDRAYFLSMDEIAERTKEAWDIGATEVCMQGGMHPEIDGNYYVELIKTVKKAVPEMHTHAFSPYEIYYGAKTLDIEEEDFINSLKDVGHNTFPGTAAEVLVEDVRKKIAPRKIPTEVWIRVVKKAHKAGMRTTSTIMYGHLDQPHHWSIHLGILRDIQKETGGFTEFVPLRFIPWNTRLYTHSKGKVQKGPTDLDQLKMYAVSRLMLRGWINNIQVSWVKQGPEFAQFSLTAGANDFGGTLMEEQISRFAGASYGQYFPPEEFRRLSREIGRIPAERDTTYGILNTFGLDGTG